MVGSFRILKKAGELRQRQFVFIFIAAKIRQKTHCNFQISKDCDHQNIKIVELYILNQIICDDCSGTFTFGMCSYFAPLIQCQVRHKIRSECTRTRLPRTWLCCLLRKVSVHGVVALGGHFSILCQELDFYGAFFFINTLKLLLYLPNIVQFWQYIVCTAGLAYVPAVHIIGTLEY